MQTKQVQVTDAQRNAIYILWAVIIVTVIEFLMTKTWMQFFDAMLGMAYIGFAIYGVIWAMNRI